MLCLQPESDNAAMPRFSRIFYEERVEKDRGKQRRTWSASLTQQAARSRGKSRKLSCIYGTESEISVSLAASLKDFDLLRFSCINSI